MDLEIRRLIPGLADDYLHFFDTTPHDDFTEGSKCYCVGWCGTDDASRDYSSPEKRRVIAAEYVQDGVLQGYLDGKAVGWCNANTKADCLLCGGWRWVMADVSAADAGARVKSVFCYVIAPELQRKGVATRLLERVCHDAAGDGFNFVEAYPFKTFTDVSRDFMGPAELYRKSGFTQCGETDKRLVMRKALRQGVRP